MSSVYESPHQESTTKIRCPAPNKKQLFCEKGGEREIEMSCSEDIHQIVIVGGGICGLATALALHRKGLNSIVLERSNILRATGAAIAILSNGWRVLDQLGVGKELRQKTIRLSVMRDVTLGTGAQQETSCGNEELRCLKRSDLVETLANCLPPGSIHFGCQIVAVGTDHITTFPVLHLHDGRIFNAKVLIGCDGVNSVVAKSLGLKNPKLYSIWTTRGFTNYPNGHSFDNISLRITGGSIVFGLLPINGKLVHWFVSQPWLPKELQKDPVLLRDSTEEMVMGFPEDVIEIVKNSDLGSLNFASNQYRTPWDLVLGNLWKGTTTIAGDAMHVMGPFLGQGGSAGLEDAVVLARCLSQALCTGSESEMSDQQLRKRVGTALGKYVKERKLRVMRLSIQTYLIGLMLESSSKTMKLLALVILIAVFGSTSLSHAQYDCGHL